MALRFEILVCVERLGQCDWRLTVEVREPAQMCVDAEVRVEVFVVDQVAEVVLASVAHGVEMLVAL